MSLLLLNKVVVVTGAAKGIGFKIADIFLENNAGTVILLDINEDEGKKAARNLNNKYGNNKAIFILCDVTKDLKNVSENIFNLYKTVDILVNNAGIFNESEISKIVNINVKAVIEWSMAFYEHMRKDKSDNGKGGTIINISSVWGCAVSNYAPTYQATKFAVYGFTKSLGHIDNYTRTGVKVIGICPGFTETDLTIDLRAWDADLQENFIEFQKQQLWQNCDDVGKATIEILHTAESGTMWMIEGAKSIVEV